MAITYNGTAIADVTYNSTSIDSATYNETQIYTRSGYVVILANATLQTDESKVPPPYDSEGYNYNDHAPKKEADLSIPLGDITSYNHISFDWDNSKSYNAYGDVLGTASIGDTTKTIFTSVDSNGTVDIDVSELSGEYALRIHIEAQSRSSYRGYTTKTVLDMTNIRGVYSAITPVDSNKFLLDSGESYVPGPYDTQGYNYGSEAPTLTKTYTLDLGDVSSKSSLSFNWATYADDDHSENDYGQVYAKYVDLNGEEQYLFNKTLSAITDTTGSVTISLSAYTGSKSLIFTVYARSRSSYRWYLSRSLLSVTNISIT